LPNDREATITVNGTTLTDAQSTTVRVAIENFAADLTADGLGDDEHGKRMSALYMERIQEIRRLIFQ
jgi:hypothetical protein